MKIKYTYQIVDERREPRGHMMYFLRCTNDRVFSEFWVGENKLRRMYREKRIVGTMTDPQRNAIGKDKRKPRTTYNEPVEVLAEPKMYSLPDVFEVEKLQYKIELRPDGLYNILAPDGSMFDDEGMPKELCEGYVSSLNKEI